MAFQPKFVDLVRNYSTTVGTDDFALGPAVNGYVDFSAALQDGDNFYYSALGVDTPAETEVGRGTLLPGGKIARDPIGGTKTNFSSGTKSIALIAAAEWFDAAQALAVSATQSVPDRPALAAHSTAAPAAYLREKAREGLFLFDSSDLSALVSADAAQGIYVARASDPSGASGAWVRKFHGQVDAGWFGLVEGDDPANAAPNTAAFAAMLAVLEARRDPYPASVRNCIERILVPCGVYWFGDAGAGAAIDLTSAVILEGHAVAFGVAAPILKFVAGVCGIRVQDANTSGISTFDSVPHQGAQGTILRNLALYGSFAGAESEAHGIVARTAVRCEHVMVGNFEGDGFHIAVSTGAVSGDEPPYGNANMSAFTNCSSNDNRNGIYFGGSDANACTILNFNANGNRQWGIYDSSFLGNNYFGGQLASNGVTQWNDGVGIGASTVSYNGQVYGAVSGQEIGASTNPPSGDTTDNSWWYYLFAGAPVSGTPAWFSGISVRAGGCIRDDQLTSVNHFAGLYAEINQGKTQIAQRSLISGGVISQWVYQNPGANKGTAVMRGDDGQVIVNQALQVATANTGITVGGSGSNAGNRLFSFSHPTMAPSAHRLKYDSNNVRFDYGDLDANVVFKISGPNTSDQFGTGAPLPNAFAPIKLMVGPGVSSALTNFRQIMIDDAAPSAGSHGSGSICFYRGTAPGLIGWTCRAGGSPGSYEALYSGYSLGPVGYQAGAGGAATQQTGKSTGVTLNKLCGQITLSAAALAAGTIASFVLTNSQIAAGDVLILNHVGGGTAGAYSLNAQAAAGAATISIRNNSAASLSEAIVIAFAVIKGANA